MGCSTAESLAEARQRIAELEQEIHGLRTLPIASDTAGVSSAPKV